MNSGDLKDLIGGILAGVGGLAVLAILFSPILLEAWSDYRKANPKPRKKASPGYTIEPRPSRLIAAAARLGIAFIGALAALAAYAWLQGKGWL